MSDITTKLKNNTDHEYQLNNCIRYKLIIFDCRLEIVDLIENRYSMDTRDIRTRL